MDEIKNDTRTKCRAASIVQAIASYLQIADFAKCIYVIWCGSDKTSFVILTVEDWVLKSRVLGRKNMTESICHLTGLLTAVSFIHRY